MSTHTQCQFLEKLADMYPAAPVTFSETPSLEDTLDIEDGTEDTSDQTDGPDENNSLAAILKLQKKKKPELTAKIAFLQKLADEADGDGPEKPKEGETEEDGVEKKPEGEEKPFAEEGEQQEPEVVASSSGPSPEGFMSVLQFFVDNPNPSDDDFHGFAEQNGLDVHMAESCAYRLATIAAQLLMGGKSKDAGLTYQDVPEDVLQKGMQVEMEHGAGEIIAKKIALDHLTESIQYYEALDKMEQSLQKGDNAEVVATPKKPEDQVAQDKGPSGSATSGDGDGGPAGGGPLSGDTEKTSMLQKLARKIKVDEANWEQRGKMWVRGSEIADQRPTRMVSPRQYRTMQQNKERLREATAHADSLKANQANKPSKYVPKNTQVVKSETTPRSGS